MAETLVREQVLPRPRFVDAQVRGPYRLWHRTHTFEPHEQGALMRDVVRYSLPLGVVGRLAHAAFVRNDLDRIFDFRAAVLGRKPAGDWCFTK